MTKKRSAFVNLSSDRQVELEEHEAVVPRKPLIFLLYRMPRPSPPRYLSLAGRREIPQAFGHEGRHRQADDR